MPSVFKLSLSTKRTRPCTLDGKPLIISTDAGGCGLLFARRTDVPAERSVNVCGAQINPAIALAATTAGVTQHNTITATTHPALCFENRRLIGLTEPVVSP